MNDCTGGFYREELYSRNSLPLLYFSSFGNESTLDRDLNSVLSHSLPTWVEKVCYGSNSLEESLVTDYLPSNIVKIYLKYSECHEIIYQSYLLQPLGGSHLLTGQLYK